MNNDKTVVITGGTGGLGYQAARAVAASRTGWLVVVAGRDERRTEDATRRLCQETGNEIVGMPLDLASLASVRRFPGELAARRLPPLRGLVCNAGVQVVGGLTRTEDGFEETFAVNHLAHFLLINLLLPDFAEQSRIILVASGTHDPQRRTGMPAPHYADAATLADPPESADGATTAGRRRYTTSKLCNVLTTYELARRLAAGTVPGDPTIRVNAFDPGLMPGSGLARDYGPLQRLVWRHLLPAATLLPINVHTRRTSGKALAGLITAPALNDVTGGYFEGRKAARSSEESYDRHKAAELWQTSTNLLSRASEGHAREANCWPPSMS
ncbi:SDR family NAD(P)-dependent oxidoreductase [Actinomadura sp. NTSP31]|uniref:SDR family NAD(P)-dependent oxidoreductase n=1 Tax=Actinomadura sp. NTSP31 TaxID=1735447 RepID=UPI0035C24181